MSAKRIRLSSSRLVFFVLLQYFAQLAVAQDVLKPAPLDRKVALRICDLLQNRHLSKHPIDDEISERCFSLFLRSLDPQKIYFQQSDIDEFSQKKDELDDLLLEGNVSFAFTVFKRFLQRLDERVKLVEELIDAPRDYSVDEEMVTDPKLLSYAKTPEDIKERWRKRIKYSILVLKTGEKEGSVHTIEARLKKRYLLHAKRMRRLDSEDITELYLTALASSFDPHSTYISRKVYENFSVMIHLRLEGIGAALQSEGGVTRVKRILPGSAASKSGKLQVNDRILSVGQGEDGEMVDIADMKLGDVVDLIRGDAGTIVRLAVMPVGGHEVKTIKFTRKRIVLKDGEAKGAIFEEGKKADGSPYKIGVIELPSFYYDFANARLGFKDRKSSAGDTAKLLNQFKSEGGDAVVLDLRKNGGGSFAEAIDCAGLFIDTGPVVQVRDSQGRVRVHDDEAEGAVWDGPLVVLTSKFSASTSEILAGAIKDYERGIIVGDSSTHGKGTIQSLMKVDESPQANSKMGALKVTIMQIYRPSGQSTQKKGVAADIFLPSMSNHLQGISKRDLDFAMKSDKVPKAEYDTFGLANRDLIERLAERSLARQKESDVFAKLMNDIANHDTRKERKSVTLNEEKFLAQLEEFKTDRKAHMKLANAAKPAEIAIKRDFYLQEVLSVTVDYLEMLGAKGVAIR